MRIGPAVERDPAALCDSLDERRGRAAPRRAVAGDTVRRRYVFLQAFRMIPERIRMTVQRITC